MWDPGDATIDTGGCGCVLLLIGALIMCGVCYTIIQWVNTFIQLNVVLP